MKGLIGKIMAYGFWTSVTIGTIYQIANPIEIPSEFNEPISNEEHILQINYLSLTIIMLVVCNHCQVIPRTH